jgi:hypothetical protein
MKAAFKTFGAEVRNAAANRVTAEPCKRESDYWLPMHRLYVCHVHKPVGVDDAKPTRSAGVKCEWHLRKEAQRS